MPCHIPNIVFRHLYIQELYIVVGKGVGWVEAAGELTAIVGALRRLTGTSQATQESRQCFGKKTF